MTYLYNPDHDILIQRIKAVVCACFKITEAELIGKARPHRVVWPRHLAMFLCRESNINYQQIADAFGGRDHASIIYAAERITELEPIDLLCRRHLADLRAQLNMPAKTFPAPGKYPDVNHNNQRDELAQ